MTNSNNECTVCLVKVTYTHKNVALVRFFMAELLVFKTSLEYICSTTIYTCLRS